MPRKSVLPFIRLPRLLRSLACVLGGGLLVASSTQAQMIIGYDPVKREYDPSEYYKTGKDLSLLNAAFYVPFAFDFGGGLYSIDSIQLVLAGTGDASSVSLLATSTLGTDLTVPPILATFSATGLASDPSVFTFHADSPSLLTSGSTYYLRMAAAGGGEDPQWVWTQWLQGVPPSQGSNPNTSGASSGGPSGSPSDIALTSLMTLNPDALTFRIAGFDSYTDVSGVYGISITAAIVPEPAAFALVIVGSTLGAGADPVAAWQGLPADQRQLRNPYRPARPGHPVEIRHAHRLHASRSADRVLPGYEVLSGGLEQGPQALW